MRCLRVAELAAFQSLADLAHGLKSVLNSPRVQVSGPHVTKGGVSQRNDL